MTGFMLGILGTLLAGLGMAILGDMVSEEARDRLDHLPHAILRLAARRLAPELRETVYEDEWLPELTYILKGDEARPVTRLIHGTRYAMGILVTASRIANLLTGTRRAAVPERARTRKGGPSLSLVSAMAMAASGGVAGGGWAMALVPGREGVLIALGNIFLGICFAIRSYLKRSNTRARRRGRLGALR